MTDRTIMAITDRQRKKAGFLSIGQTLALVDRGKTAFEFLHVSLSSGIVLTGTGRAAHLRENARNFYACQTKGRPD